MSQEDSEDAVKVWDSFGCETIEEYTRNDEKNFEEITETQKTPNSLNGLQTFSETGLFF